MTRLSGYLAKILVAEGTSDVEVGTLVAIMCEVQLLLRFSVYVCIVVSRIPTNQTFRTV